MLKLLLVFLGLWSVSKTLSLTSMSVVISISILMWLLTSSYTFTCMSYFLVDSLSWFLIILTLWIILLMLVSSSSYFQAGFHSDKFCSVLSMMVVFLVLTFSCYDLLSFYVFFEGSLIPIYMLIVGWGYQPERLQAGIYLFLYTIFASLPLLISLILMVKVNNSFSMALMSMNKLMFTSPLDFWFFFSSVAFLVKLPSFFVHLWLPKAHVEAPVSGSMVLAGVLLKLGCYGLMRIMMFFQGFVYFLSSFFVSLGLVGGLFVGLICLRQIDLKSLIAYSSVSHMGLLLAGLGSWGIWGFSGSLYMCVAHGLCSSGLFFLSGVVFERSGSRSFSINKGMISIMPSSAFWWFMFSIGNLGAPIVLNLIGELSLIGSILGFSLLSGVILMMFSFVGAAYSLFLFSSTQHGNFYSGVHSYGDNLVREHLVLFLHFMPLFFLILEVDFMTY
uniref:NADH-ubiquinone oxidoreductase chain 4 n=1 Tax=Lepas anserifera TaxID=245079 RepID=A0A0C5CG95_9CRUS|nr:NADH dehydrogenase subunit 4 [Lepas anserifera]AJN90589.1 NADH dehydrogenase subunit 4 [Lepas anserifera]